jgi:hypothetical protein
MSNATLTIPAAVTPSKVTPEVPTSSFHLPTTSPGRSKKKRTLLGWDGKLAPREIYSVKSEGVAIAPKFKDGEEWVIPYMSRLRLLQR